MGSYLNEASNLFLLCIFFFLAMWCWTSSNLVNIRSYLKPRRKWLRDYILFLYWSLSQRKIPWIISQASKWTAKTHTVENILLLRCISIFLWGKHLWSWTKAIISVALTQLLFQVQWRTFFFFFFFWVQVLNCVSLMNKLGCNTEILKQLGHHS